MYNVTIIGIRPPTPTPIAIRTTSSFDANRVDSRHASEDEKAANT